MRGRGSPYLQKPEPDKISDCKLWMRPAACPYPEDGGGIQFDACIFQREVGHGRERQWTGYDPILMFLAAERGVLVPAAEMGEPPAFEFGKGHLWSIVIPGKRMALPVGETLPE